MIIFIIVVMFLLTIYNIFLQIREIKMSKELKRLKADNELLAKLNDNNL